VCCAHCLGRDQCAVHVASVSYTLVASKTVCTTHVPGGPRGQVSVEPVCVQRHRLHLCSGSEAGSYLRLTDSCITQLKAQGPFRTCNESKEEEEGMRWCVHAKFVRTRQCVRHARHVCGTRVVSDTVCTTHARQCAQHAIYIDDGLVFVNDFVDSQRVRRGGGRGLAPGR